MPDHTVRAFGQEIDELLGLIARMGGVAEVLVADSLTAFAKRDSEMARSVVAADRTLDGLQRDVERRVLRLFALRQPMARDLREAISALKIAGDLERIGDLAKNTAKRTVVLNETEVLVHNKAVLVMGKRVAGHLNQVLDAYINRDVDRALSVWYQDEDIDEHYNSLFREILLAMADDSRSVGPYAHLLFITKNIERIGDHCTNISETVHFLVTGEELVFERPKSGSVLDPERP
ncbi:MAG TPA: phosphate transport system regulatory protein PhoU [Hyphomonadaceae bacterium]|nr:phosphate transport system regulatory protein PhoU [Hyphomonadaceae bacterium]